MNIPVAMARCEGYEHAQETVALVMQTAGIAPPPSTHVLVKPNLLAAAPGGLACTHPSVVRAVCAYLLDHGCTVQVGDSPAFGTARAVAKGIGLTDALSGMDVEIVNFDKARRIPLSFGASIGVSVRALEADVILNVPKLKAHCQVRLTAAVKNLFGAVPGTRKAIAHTRHGDKDTRFETMLIEIMDALPDAPSVIDGVVCMHKQGPRGGDPYQLGLIGASPSPVALDTALYTLMGIAPETMLIGAELIRREYPGAAISQLKFPIEKPEAFDASGFVFPDLIPVTFNPLTLLRSALERAWHRIRS